MRTWRERGGGMLACLRTGRFLQSSLDGETDAPTTRRVREHLERCRRCGPRAATYQAIKAGVARRGRAAPPDLALRVQRLAEQLADGSGDHAR